MTTRTPGASTSYPVGQARQQYHRNWGNYTSVADLPNDTANALALPYFTLEVGDSAWVTGDGFYVCTYAGTAGGADAVWVRLSTGGPVTAAEIDFGALPTWDAEFVIVDALVGATSVIGIWQSGATATGRVGNDAEWDQILLAASPGVGQFTVTAIPSPGPVVGKRKILYQVS